MALSITARRILRLLHPAAFARELRRVSGKLRRRLRRIEDRVVSLEPEGPRRGRVLLSYVVDPFCLPPGAEPSYDHTHHWECREMARAWLEAGYAVDAIHWTNTRFEPGAAYDVLVDPLLNLERLAPRLGPECLAVLHAETAHHSFHNAAQRRRLEALQERRGLELPPARLIEENRAVEHADAIVVLGNDFTAGTYAFGGRPMLRVPLSNPFLYPFPEDKDFEAARRRFVWFGSGGLVHKGLDLVLEAFAGLPDLHLTVCGPIAREPAFERAYWRELYRTRNVTTLGWVDVAGTAFRELARTSVAAVYPSCSEGGGGSVITCMHAGLVPVVTPEASVDVTAERGVVLREASVEGVRRAARELSNRPAAELRATARAAWSFARERHTRETFAREYRRAVRELLLLEERGPGVPESPGAEAPG
ncbi:MAG TPA: glycosyltransferase [Thermoanaerobaculia bacterium]|nr:glycosyltransferase [Thermoanaerobaculia bacterium]